MDEDNKQYGRFGSLNVMAFYYQMTGDYPPEAQALEDAYIAANRSQWEKEYANDSELAEFYGEFEHYVGCNVGMWQCINGFARESYDSFVLFYEPNIIKQERHF